MSLALHPSVITGLSATTLYPGLQLTISGSGFGATQQSDIVAVGAQAGGIVNSWADNQIVVTVPSTGLQPGNIAVQQYGVWSNGVAYCETSVK